MPRSEVRYLRGVDIKNSDTTGATKFQDITVPANVEVDVGEYDVPSDCLKATWGGGKMFAVLFDNQVTAARIEGKWRFYVANTQGVRYKVFEADSRGTVGASGQRSVPSEHNIMPMGARYAPAGGKLIVSFEAEAAATTDSTDHTLDKLPVTLVYP